MKVDNIRFGMMKQAEVREVVERCIFVHSSCEETGFPGDGNYEDAVDAATAAFWRADSSAGNGMGSDGTATKGIFFAKANIETKELELFKKII